jgi:beta-lactamase regulating signal transducer with metallopeptidase domain
MNAIAFLGEWGLRSAALVISGALLLWALRVKDPAIRLAAWTAMLVGSLAIPLLTAALPKAPVPVAAVRVVGAAPAMVRVEFHGQAAPAPRFDWTPVALAVYLLGAGALLLRLGAGLVMSHRLLRRSRFTGREADGIQIRESESVPAPVVLGIVWPAIVLPPDWREWDAAKLEAVVAHERSHVRRNDPLVQLLSAIHRALVWHSPLSWFLDRRIVRAAEDASDDAAVAATRDRTSYAEVLLDFMRGAPRVNLGVGMARYGRPDERIHRILDGTAVSRGVTRWSLAAILALGSPVAYVVATAAPQDGAPRAPFAPAAPRAAAAASPASTAMAAAAPQAAQAAAGQASAPQQGRTVRRYVIVLGDSTTSGSWNSSDPVDQEDLRARFGRRFAWFRQGGNEYVITDAGVLDQLEQAMQPQMEVNRMQSEVNRLQSAVNTMQGEVNSQQAEVNTLQQQANRRQDMVNRIQAAVTEDDKQALLQKLQDMIVQLQSGKADADQKAVNQRQAQVNQEQSRVNGEQQKVNDEQHKVNDAQRRVSAEYNRRMEEIFDSAVRRHLAQQLM